LKWANLPAKGETVAINSFTLEGHMTRDPEAKGDKGLVMFGVASNDSKEYSSFYDCKAFDHTGKFIMDYGKKGSQIIIQGKLKQDRWEADGTTKSRVVLMVYEVTLPRGNQNTQPNSSYSKKPAPSSSLPSLDSLDDGDIPF
jgi:single-strand DNA-binding protein